MSSGLSSALRKAMRMQRAAPSPPGDGEVMCVGGVAVAGELTVNPRPPSLGMLQLFEDQDSRAFPHHESIALFIEGARGVLGITVTCAHGFHGAEAADADGHDGCFGAAGKHHLGI